MFKPCVGIAITLCASVLDAQPNGHEVVHGHADVQSLQNLLKITAGDKAIINWKEFSSAAGEAIQFIQPSSSAAVLNRVTGVNTSTLYGHLEANGQVYLVNPNGIVIGQHARIDAGAFVASTFDVLDRDFIEGSAIGFFGDSKAGVINLGSIKTSSGDAILIGFQVENDGSIEASGKAALVASNKVVLKPYASQRIFIIGDVPVSNGGMVENPQLLAFNQTIERDALHFKKESSGVFLMIDEPIATAAGSINAESVVVMGDFVQVLDGADIDVSALEGGGEILIGGGFQGRNDTFVNSRQTYVSREARLTADGQSAGGRIVLWSNEATGMYGTISAQPKGFVEISSYGFLAADGAVDTAGGVLLLDPTNITIQVNGGVDSANVTFPTAITVTPPPCPGFANPLTYAFSSAPGVIDNTRLAAFLGCNNVVVSSASGFADVGNITVTAPVIWNSAFSLTLDTNANAGSISITADIQNTGIGGVTLNSNTGAVNIGSATGATRVSVGSSNGPTLVNAPNAIVTIRGSNNGANRPGQLGFYTPSGSASTGTISVTANQLFLTGGNVLSGACIGHGQLDVTSNSSTTAAATINVNVAGTITLLSSPLLGIAQSFARIGHGSNRWDTNVAASANQAGDILVISNNGSITLTTSNQNIVNCGAVIGHGWLNEVAGGVNFPTLSGDITVRAPAGNISLLGNATLVNNQAMIGLGTNLGAQVASITSDIDVVCGGNLILNGTTGAVANNVVNIGCAAGLGTNAFVQNIRTTVGGSLTMTPGSRAIIGTQVAFAGVAPFSFTGDTEVVVGQNITMGGGTGPGAVAIGVFTGGGAFILAGNTSVAAGGNILIDRTASVPAGIGGIAAFNNVNVSAQGGITVLAGLATAFIGTSNRQGGGNATTSIYTCGSIVATNSATSVAALGFDSILGAITPPYNVNIRAGGDVHMGAGFTAANDTGAGFILVEADADILSGDLWNYTGANLTDIAGQPLNPLFPIIDTNLLPPPINAPSQACVPDGLGAFTVLTGPLNPTNNIIFQTTSGDITVHSASARVDGTLQNLGIGTAAPDNLDIQTISGDIEIAASVPDDGFNNIAINSVAATWTSGTIFVAASNDLDVNDAVVTSGAGNFITLIADVDDTGFGNLTIIQNVTTNAGPILLDAGFGLFGGSSAINQTGGQINSTGGLITAQAVGNITFNGAATSVTSGVGNISVTSTAGSITAFQDVTSTSGNIGMSAGVDVNIVATGSVSATAGGNIDINAGNDITVNGDPTSISSTTGYINTLAGNNTFVTQNVATAGPITMITGLNMFLLAATTNISSSASPVILVVDNDFPSPPGIGPGLFSSVVGSQVNSGPGQPLQIFTARQNQNIILGSLNGFPFIAGIIFTDTPTEHWCIYYPDAFFGGPGYTIFYKDCLQAITPVGNTVVSEMLFNLEDMWMEEFDAPLFPPEIWRFMFIYSPGVNGLKNFDSERYWLSRRTNRFIHYPYVYKENKPLSELVPTISRVNEVGRAF